MASMSSVVMVMGTAAGAVLKARPRSTYRRRRRASGSGHSSEPAGAPSPQ
jgi:hypothetical protein